jgi:putative membrane protein
MSIISIILIALIAILHLYILWFEMFAWTSRGPKIFSSFPKDLFEPTKAMAANQGLYNGFLSAGLIWSLLISDPIWAPRIAICFLLFVAVAGVYGSMTASRRILYVQTVPAVLALLSILVF